MLYILCSELPYLLYIFVYFFTHISWLRIYNIELINTMDYAQYILAFVVLLVVGIFGDQLRGIFTSKHDQKDEYEQVKQYLLNESPLYGYNRPKIWIHTKYEYNARRWKSFYSRSSYDLNQPYIHLTIKSVINHCGDDFNVCLIDDESFSKLIPTWDVDMSKTVEPVKTHLRELGMAQLVYYYGGLVVPNSFICCKNLMPMYQDGIGGEHGKQFFVVERPNRHDGPIGKNLFVPDCYIMGAEKNCAALKEYIDYLKHLNQVGDTRVLPSLGPIPLAPGVARVDGATGLIAEVGGGDDRSPGERSAEEASGMPALDGPRGAATVQAFYTNETEFTGEKAQWLLRRVREEKIGLIGGEFVGVKTRQKTAIDLDELMGDGFLDVDNRDLYGVFIPADDLLIRPKYAWFAVLPTHQVLDSHTVAAKYLKMSIMDSADLYYEKNGEQKSVVAL